MAKQKPHEIQIRIASLGNLDGTVTNYDVIVLAKKPIPKVNDSVKPDADGFFVKCMDNDPKRFGVRVRRTDTLAFIKLHKTTS